MIALGISPRVDLGPTHCEQFLSHCDFSITLPFFTWKGRVLTGDTHEFT